MTFTIPLPADIPSDICREIAKRSVYCDGDIERAAFDDTEYALEITINNSDDTGNVREKVEALIDRMKQTRLNIEPKTVKSRVRDHNRFKPAVFEQLTESGAVHKEAPGLIAQSEGFLELLNELDGLFQQIGESSFDAKNHRFTTLIPTDWLRRAGYFSSFAHSLTFAFHLKEDLPLLEQFAERHRGEKDLSLSSLDEIHPPECCLSPAVCYHAYGMLQNSKFSPDDNGLKVFTAAGTCFRYESKNITDLDRLWEFGMREIIFVGEMERVLAAREKSIELIWSLIEYLDLTASIVTASDPFFVTEFSSLRFFQLANDLKYELLMPVKEGHEIAVASFNYHEHFFGNNFDITTEAGEPVHTGCTAFGLERFVYALIAQLGMSKALEKVRSFKKQNH